MAYYTLSVDYLTQLVTISNIHFNPRSLTQPGYHLCSLKTSETNNKAFFCGSINPNLIFMPFWCFSSGWINESKMIHTPPSPLRLKPFQCVSMKYKVKQKRLENQETPGWTGPLVVVYLCYETQVTRDRYRTMAACFSNLSVQQSPFINILSTIHFHKLREDRKDTGCRIDMIVDFVIAKCGSYRRIRANAQD